MPRPLEPYEDMNPIGYLFFYIFCVLIDIACSVWLIALFLVAAVGSVVNSIGESISALGQFLMKADPLR